MRIGNFSLNSTEIFCSNICFSSKESKILERILAFLAAWRITIIICSMAFLQFTCMYSKSLIIGMTRYRKNVLIIKFINNGFIKILVFNDILFSKKIPMVGMYCEDCGKWGPDNRGLAVSVHFHWSDNSVRRSIDQIQVDMDQFLS